MILLNSWNSVFVRSKRKMFVQDYLKGDSRYRLISAYI